MLTPKLVIDKPRPADGPFILLARLAKAGSFVELVLKVDGTRALTLVSSAGSGTTTKPLPYAYFDEARDQGWISDLDGSGLRWGLTSGGRVALRRYKSTDQAPQASTHMQALETRQAPPTKAHIDPAESPLAWLRSRRDKHGQPMLSAVEFDAGERLRADLWFAQMTPRVTANWSATGGSSSRSGGGIGVDITDNAAAAQQRARRALEAVGPLSSGLLVDICGHLLGLEIVERNRGWPPRSGKIALQMALGELARHYGLPNAPESGRTSVRHWASEDYRPA